MFVRAWRGNKADDEGGVMEAGAYAGDNAGDRMGRYVEGMSVMVNPAGGLLSCEVN
jgi:hypothetical protein